MPFAVEYTPPAMNAAAAMQAGGELFIDAVGKELLSMSQELVPVDKGPLKASGHVTKEAGLVVAVSYGMDDGDATHAPTAAYAIVQHEDSDLNHPNGGQANYLGEPMSRGGEILAAAAPALKVMFG